MKVLIILVSLLILMVAVFKNSPSKIRSYAVRENIAADSFDLWCWSDMSNGKIQKRFIGSFNGNLNVDRVETSLCR